MEAHPLDEHLPAPLQKATHVYTTPGNVYSVVLNQPTIGTNNYKFYIIQLLEADGGGKYYLFTRWGRVGSAGMNSVRDYSTAPQAISAFEKKFSAKTRNAWAQRDDFVAVPGKYVLVGMDGGGQGDEKEKRGVGGSTSVAPAAVAAAAPSRTFGSGLPACFDMPLRSADIPALDMPLPSSDIPALDMPLPSADIPALDMPLPDEEPLLRPGDSAAASRVADRLFADMLPADDMPHPDFYDPATLRLRPGDSAAGHRTAPRFRPRAASNPYADMLADDDDVFPDDDMPHPTAPVEVVDIDCYDPMAVAASEAAPEEDEEEVAAAARGLAEVALTAADHALSPQLLAVKEAATPADTKAALAAMYAAIQSGEVGVGKDATGKSLRAAIIEQCHAKMGSAQSAWGPDVALELQRVLLCLAE